MDGRLRNGVAVALCLGVVSIPFAFGLRIRPEVPLPAIPLDSVPLTPADVADAPALKAAAEKYWQRGGQYIWGTNDCSVFVTEYLVKRGIALEHRLTTATMKGNVAKHGLKKVKSPKPGDIINYRYRSLVHPGMAGHCGVIVSRGDNLYVIHNASETGLVIQPFQGFVAHARELGVRAEGIDYLRSVGRK